MERCNTIDAWGEVVIVFFRDVQAHVSSSKSIVRSLELVLLFLLFPQLYIITVIGYIMATEYFVVHCASDLLRSFTVGGKKSRIYYK